MIQGKTVLAYIPARSGSKGIKDKNIADLGGKPLIAHTIEAAKKSKYVDRLLFTTDSQKYADIAVQHGAEAPFLRPDHLASDTAVEMDTTIHLMNWIEENEGKKYDFIVRLQATSPLRDAEDIDKAIEKAVEREADTIISVSEAPTPIDWINVLPEDESMIGFRKRSTEKMNRQTIPTYYQLNGAIYIATWKQIKEKRSWYDCVRSFAYILAKEKAVDIDEPIDLELARVLVKKSQQN